MMDMPIGVVLIMTFMICTVVGVLIALGRVIYRDAKALGMNAGLWTTCVILLPNLIGLIIYLVVRNNTEKPCHCSECGETVKSDYNVCPNCKSLFEKICNVCKNALKGDMPYCPYCGSKVEEMELVQTAKKVSPKTNITKSLAKVGGGYLAMVVLALVLVAVVETADSANGLNLSIMNIETNTSNQMEAKFAYKRGDRHMSFNLNEGELKEVAVQIYLSKGQITLQVEDPTGKIIHEKVYTTGSQTEILEVGGAQQGRYTVSLLIEGAAGNYSVKQVE